MKRDSLQVHANNQRHQDKSRQEGEHQPVWDRQGQEIRRRAIGKAERKGNKEKILNQRVRHAYPPMDFQICITRQEIEFLGCPVTRKNDEGANLAVKPGFAPSEIPAL
jgi:hypothetical protein